MWIIQREENRTDSLPIFRKRFKLSGKVKNCELKITALGIFDVEINGKDIKEYFMPGWTNYNKYVNICTYDITKYVKCDNEIAVTVANGWYSGRLGYTGKSEVYGKEKALYVELTVEYENGTTEKITTDETWKVGLSNVIKADLFDGQTVDYNVKKQDYELLPFAKEYGYVTEFNGYDYEPVVQIDTLHPKCLKHENGVIRLDFEQNFSGVISFTACGEKGAEIIVKYAEVLNDDGSLYLDNLRSAKATDRIILSEKKVKFLPKFTCHGFRYAEITVNGNAKISNIKGIVLSEKIKYHGSFTCSNGIINKIFKNVSWGQKDNFISIPTDCPQRDERLGWTGDAEVFCNTAMYNANCDKFFRNYMKLIRADVLPDGKIPSFVPFFITVSDSTAGVPGWADVITVLPYYHYLHYKNADVLKENLPYAIGYINYFLKNSTNCLTKVKNPFGDWLSVKETTDVNVINQCFFGLTTKLVSKSYKVLGDEESSKKYEELYNNVKKAFRENYLNGEFVIQSDTQTAYAFSYAVGFVTAEEIRKNFVNSIERNGNKLTTGFVGVKYLLPSLCDVGETDLAYKLAKETEYPSWGYTIENGATTVWERWNGYTKENGFETPKMNSFNHYSLGSCGEWFYSYVLGIKLSTENEIVVSPAFSKELDFAKGKYTSCYGDISVSWKQKNGIVVITVKADENVPLVCDFGKYTVLKSVKNGNTVKTTVKI